jgi:hypothetical protein
MRAAERRNEGGSEAEGCATATAQSEGCILLQARRVDSPPDLIQDSTGKRRFSPARATSGRALQPMDSRPQAVSLLSFFALYSPRKVGDPPFCSHAHRASKTTLAIHCSGAG